jgi:hypothetical protein
LRPVISNYTDPLDRLTDYVHLYLSRLQARKSGTIEPALLPQEAALLRYCVKTGDIGPIVAEALMLAADDLYEEDDADRPNFGDGRTRALEHEEAMRLVKKHGSVRLAAVKGGYSRSAMHRAYTGDYSDARKAA